MTHLLTTLLVCVMCCGCTTVEQPQVMRVTKSEAAVIVPQTPTKTWQCECWFMTNNVWGPMTIAFEYIDDLTQTNWTILTSYELTTVSNQFTVPLTESQRYYRAVINY